jgi:hypothetical protein
MNAAGALVLAPVTISLVRWYGITGAAYAWLGFNIVNFLLLPYIAFRQVLGADYRQWLMRDTLPLMLLAGTLFGIVRWALGDETLTRRVAAVIGTGALYVVVGLRIAPAISGWLHPLRGALRRRFRSP